MKCLLFITPPYSETYYVFDLQNRISYYYKDSTILNSFSDTETSFKEYFKMFKIKDSAFFYIDIPEISYEVIQKYVKKNLTELFL